MILLLAVSLSIDAFAVAFAHGVRGTKITALSKLIVCILSFACFGGAVLLGHWLTQLLPLQAANLLGVLFMLGVFVFMLVGMFKPQKPKIPGKSSSKKTLVQLTLRSLGITLTIIRDPMLCDLDDSHSISGMEALFLGLALSVDSIAVGVGYSLSAGVGVLDVLIVGLVQLLLLSLGNFLGRHCHKISLKHSDKLQLVSCAIMLIILAVRVFQMI
ncbi:MAG: manganese efflux pump [Oscillospiraceae bacterium]|jgi:putative sporulation protein YtaF|nr:manganese efflux pump [Oscillospiraceae bacterium]